MDTQINVNKWLTAAEDEVDDVEGALNALGAEQTAECIKVHGLANLDAAGVAEYLRDLATKLSVVAVNLRYLADHADLTGVVASLRVDASTNPHAGAVSTGTHVSDAGIDTCVDDADSVIVTTQNPPANVDPELEGKTAEELLGMLDALNKGGS